MGSWSQRQWRRQRTPGPTSSQCRRLLIDMVNSSPDASGISHFELEVEPGRYRDTAGQILEVREAVLYNCMGVQHNPHFSGGANGVISKAQVKCTGPSGVIPIRVNSALAKSPTNDPSKLSLKASSSYVQNVTLNTTGWAQTWYVPALGSPGVPLGTKGWWRAAHSGESVPPLKTFQTYPARSQMVPLP